MFTIQHKPRQVNFLISVTLFCIASLLLFLPILHNSFLSDDFAVMKRVGADKTIFIRGFFRPLSDVTLYLNYRIGGFNPKGYYLFNILLHGINSYLLFRFCLNWRWANDERKQYLFA